MAAARKHAHNQTVPLPIDLDDTLIGSDLLMDSALALPGKKPPLLFAMIVWLLGGKAHPHTVSNAMRAIPRTTWRCESLQSQQPLCPIVLGIGSDFRLAQRVAAHVGFFSDLLASDEERNLDGRKKVG
jgi:hypothetical protein